MPLISCDKCSITFKRKPSEIGVNNFCSRKCSYNAQTKTKEHKDHKKFIKNSWTNMNIRAGKYRHLQTAEKCLHYTDVKITFTRAQFVDWCNKRKEKIKGLERPSIDRIKKDKDYSLYNMQIIELSENIRKERTVFTKTAGRCYLCKLTKSIEDFCNDRRRSNGKTSVCKLCESVRNRNRYVRSKEGR